MSARTLASSTTEVEDITIPDSPAALEEFMADRKNMLAILQQNKFEDLVRKYADVVLKKNLDINRQVQEQVQAGIANYLRDASEEGLAPVNMNVVQAQARGLVAGAPPVDPRHGLYNPAAVGAKLDRDFQGPHAASEFFNLIWRNYKRTLDTEGVARMKRIRDAFQSDVPSDGGFLIPETLRSEMLRISLESGIVRQRARVIPMETLRVPFPMIDSSTNNGSVYGGIVCYWTEEGGTLQDSSPQFGRVVLEAKKLTAYTQVPQELVADSIISFQPFISQIFPEALGFYEDVAFLKGTGVGEPTGALNAAKNLATIVIDKEGSQGAGTVVWENIIGMFARMLPSSMGRAVWVASIDTLPQLATMALAVGTGGSAVWMPNGVGGPPLTLLGRPIVFTEKTPGSVGTQGDISLVDFGFYLVGDRQVMSSSVSEHYRFGNDELAFKITERVDGRPWLQNAITPQNGGATLSPFVQLETRA